MDLLYMENNKDSTIRSFNCLFDEINLGDMSKYTGELEDTEQLNGATLAVISTPLQRLSIQSRVFNCLYNEREPTLSNYLLTRPQPHLIIKLFGTKNRYNRNSLRASVHNALKGTISMIMEQANIWLLNGTRDMIGLDDYVQSRNDDNELDSNQVKYISYGRSLLLMYHPTADDFIDKVLFGLREQQQGFSQIPIVAMLMQGDTTSATDMIENVSKHIPVIILKGTGLIANQLAAKYEHGGGVFKAIPNKLFNERLLSQKQLRQLDSINSDRAGFIFVCQPGKNEVTESILRAVSVATQTTDISNPHIIEFSLAMRFNSITYVQKYVLNYDTIINWTNDELDRYLEVALLSNAVPFVELLFQYGASLERLALISSFERFKIKLDGQTKKHFELSLDALPVVLHLDPDKRARIHLNRLFRWAVENEYFDLVLSICTRLEDSVTALLLASQWCLRNEQHSHSNSVDYRKHRHQFQQYAAELLDLYYRDNEADTIKSLTYTSTLYQEQKPSVLIDDLGSRELVSTKCMQSYASVIWYGDQFHRQKNFVWEILICLVCLCPVLLFFPCISHRVFQSHNAGDNKSNSFSTRKPIRKDRILGRFYRFYRGNTVIRFHYNMASYVAFLILFSYTILFDYFPLNIYQEKRSGIKGLGIPITEIILHIFLLSIGVEELRQMYLHFKSITSKSEYWERSVDKNIHRNRIWSYYKSDRWNILDFAAFIFWIVGFATRFVVQARVFEVSKIFMSLDLCLWYMRCLHIFLASEVLGPKLIMIFRTMKDLILFLFFILIFHLAYTITTYSLITTPSFVTWFNATYFTTRQDGGPLNNTDTFRNLVEWGTWKIFGSTSLTTSDAVDEKFSAKNDSYGFVTLFLSIIFLIVAYVLLLNNLIALFNFTIQRVHNESHQAWCHHFYVVLREYEEKDIFAPPFNILLFPLSLYLRKRSSSSSTDTSNITSNNNANISKRIRKRQQEIAERYWKEKQIVEKKSLYQESYLLSQCKCCSAERSRSDLTML